MQSKTTMRYRLTPVRTAVITNNTNNKCQGVGGEKSLSYIVGGNVNWPATVENNTEISQKTTNRTPYDPAILLLGIY